MRVTEWREKSTRTPAMAKDLSQVYKTPLSVIKLIQIYLNANNLNS